MKPIVAIVGKPNVGKSTLFNRIVGGRRAIVDDVPGVTRDRHYKDTSWVGKDFILVDTGGITLDDEEAVENAVTRQSMSAIEEADVIICLFDGREELNVLDEHVITMLRASPKPVVYVVNKIDSEDAESINADFYSHGIKKLHLISSEHGRGIGEFLDEVVSYFPADTENKEHVESDALFVSVVGRPNVGKSTLINRLLGEERLVTHNMAGTTRDMIDVPVEYKGTKYVFVDTAGIKRKAKTHDRLDKVSMLKSLKAIERSDIVLMIIDGEEGFTHQDAQLLDYVTEKRRALVCIINKCDMLPSMPQDEYYEYLRKLYYQLHSIPFLAISAKTGHNCSKIFATINRISEAMKLRIGTSDLNNLMEDITSSHHLPVYRGKHLKMYYASQVDSWPPTFIISTNYPEGIPESYKRFVASHFQKLFGEGVPLVIKYKKR